MDDFNEQQPEQSGDAADQQLSPIRPKHPTPPQPKSGTQPIKPAPPRAAEQIVNSDDNTTELSPTEKAQFAIDRLSEKMSELADEYSAGKLNEAQFNAIYKRYSEQRQITERLLARDPDSNAWESVVQTGHTSFLRDHFAAKIVSYAIYVLADGQQITLQGKLRLPSKQLNPLIQKIRSVVNQGHTLGPAWRKLRDDNWILIVPGKFAVSVVIFSLEPATTQRKKAEDAHRDFERANERALKNEIYDETMLVFPHRALLHNLT